MGTLNYLTFVYCPVTKFGVDTAGFVRTCHYFCIPVGITTRSFGSLRPISRNHGLELLECLQ